MNSRFSAAMRNETTTLALDTNLLAYPSSRRLLHGVALDTGVALVVLPEVYNETWRRVGLIEASHWEDDLEEDSRYSDSHKQRIVDAVVEGAREWFEGELARDESVFEPLHETLDQAWAARRIVRNLPADSIRGHDRLAEGDPLIIAQAIVFDVALLSTNNLSTIHHERINEWASARGRNQPLLHLPDETLESLAGESRDKTYEWTIAHGPWQADSTDENTCRQDYEAAVQRLDGAGFAKSARQAQWDYEQDDRFMTRVRALSGSDHARTAQEAELRLRTRVMDSAIDAGWSR